MKLFLNILKTSRLKQQTKNLLILVPIFLSLNYWWGESSSAITTLLLDSIIGIISFAFSSWFIYIINDFIDKEKDIDHPEKSLRPIVAGEISNKAITALSAILLILSLILGIQLNINFFLCIISYNILMIFYCIFLKKLFLIDVLIVSGGYMLRALSGVTIITSSSFYNSEVNIPIWLLLCTGFGALFVLLIKRLTEIKSNYLKRDVIKNYSLSRLHLLIISSELLTYFSYLFYCISSNLFPSLKANTPSDYSLLFTMPFVVFGMRYYKYLSLNNDKGDQPEVIIFKNKLLILNFILWVATSSLIIFYRI